MSYEGVKGIYTGAGLFYMTPFHFFLQNLSIYPPILYHILTFIMYFGIVVFFYYTLPYLKIKKDKRFILSAFFAIIPINAARIYMICFTYTSGILFCFAGLYLFTVAYYKRQIIIRIVSLIFCIISFLMLQSTFIFIPAYIAFILILNETNKTFSLITNLRNIIVQTLKYADFIIITITSWIWLSIYAKPTGLYAAESYNAITWKAIVLSPLNFIRAIIESFTHLTNFTDEQYMILGFSFLLVLLFIVFRKKSIPLTADEKYNFLFRNKSIRISSFSMWGLYFMIAGSFAYVLVDKTPEFINITSRHQILLGVGISLLLTDFIANCINPKYIKSVFIVLLTFFITVNIDNCLIFQRAHYKHLALMKEIEKKEEIVNNKNFIINDNTAHYNSEGFRFYTWTGMAKKVFGNETRLILDKASYYDSFISKSIDINLYKKQQYNMNDISFNNTFDHYIIVDPDEINLSKYKNIVRLMIEEHFFRQQFAHDIDKILTIRCVPYKNEK
jgi:hypothetical protein